MSVDLHIVFTEAEHSILLRLATKLGTDRSALVRAIVHSFLAEALEKGSATLKLGEVEVEV
jgi:hypothetical protein